MPIHVIAGLHPKPEFREAVRAELDKMVAATRAEPGNLRYDLFEPVDGQPGFYLYEAYRDAAALETHRNSPHYQDYRRRVGDWLAGPTAVTVLRALDLAGE